MSKLDDRQAGQAEPPMADGRGRGDREGCGGREGRGRVRRRPGDLAEWAVKVALRLAMLKEPGVYDVQLIVRPDKTRELVIRNAEQPHKLEHLGM